MYSVGRGSYCVSETWKNSVVDTWCDVPIPDAYPQYFSPCMNSTGKMLEVEQNNPVQRIPVVATLYNGPTLNPYFEKIKEDCKLAIQGYRMGEMIAKDFEAGGIEREHWEQIHSEIEDCIWE
jgi:hypothetical protein